MEQLGYSSVKRIEHLEKNYVAINWRQQIFHRDDYTCQRCLIRGKKLNAHHVYYLRFLLQDVFQKYGQEYVHKNFSTMPELWDVNNGITLCDSCHRKTHIEGEHIWL
jgi:5-methylcytosine-specific restriction endonuclease McrA